MIVVCKTAIWLGVAGVSAATNLAWADTRLACACDTALCAAVLLRVASTVPFWTLCPTETSRFAIFPGLGKFTAVSVERTTAPVVFTVTEKLLFVAVASWGEIGGVYDAGKTSLTPNVIAPMKSPIATTNTNARATLGDNVATPKQDEHSHEYKSRSIIFLTAQSVDTPFDLVENLKL